MSKKDKRLERLLQIPKDYEWSELVSLLQSLGFVMEQGSGSRVSFFHPDRPNVPIHLHEPHNRKPKTIYCHYLKDVCAVLRELGYVE
jgi:predicted RNA binding protein YcfA (HicA-like mRNA interferase family)